MKASSGSQGGGDLVTVTPGAHGTLQGTSETLSLMLRDLLDPWYLTDVLENVVDGFRAGIVEEEAGLVLSFLFLSGEHSLARSKVLDDPNLKMFGRFVLAGRLATFSACSRIATLSLTLKVS